MPLRDGTPGCVLVFSRMSVTLCLLLSHVMKYARPHHHLVTHFRQMETPCYCFQTRSGVVSYNGNI